MVRRSAIGIQVARFVEPRSASISPGSTPNARYVRRDYLSVVDASRVPHMLVDPGSDSEPLLCTKQHYLVEYSTLSGLNLSLELALVISARLKAQV